MWRSFWCAMVAAMTLKLLDPFGSGKIVLFQVTYDRVSSMMAPPPGEPRSHFCQDWHTFELVGFVLLGVFGGAYGALFCRVCASTAHRSFATDIEHAGQHLVDSKRQECHLLKVAPDCRGCLRHPVRPRPRLRLICPVRLCLPASPSPSRSFSHS